jgi:hypothetical protein
MNIEELEELATALYGLSMVQAGIIAAHKVTIDAFIGAVALSLLPLLAAISDNLNGLQNIERRALDQASLSAFDNAVAGVQQSLKVLQW